MSDYADLELSLRSSGETTYEVEMRFTPAHSDADIRWQGNSPAQITFDLDSLRANALNSEAYGRCLTDNLFAHPDIKTYFGMAQSSTQSADSRLRLRLFIAKNAAALHALRWETLRDPLNPEQTLATHDSILFSRYLMSNDWRPVGLRPQDDLRALILIANPSDLGKYNMNEVKVADELARVQTALGDVPTTVLDSGGKATLDSLMATLHDGFDLLYIVCHGSLSKPKSGEESDSILWLENDKGEVDRVAGRDLVKRLNELPERPRLIVLASCQTGESNPDSEVAFLTLGPRLAQEGIPAVLAMQGKITVETIEKFMPIFFTELRQHGEIDRAMATARRQVQKRSDWWMPVLFMRLKSGRIGWYTTGFTSDDQLRVWDGLKRNILDDKCTPVLGVGMLEPMFGSPHEMARRWAEKHHFPLASKSQDDLTQVAQFLAIDQDRNFPRSSLVKYMCEEVRGRNAADLSVSWQEADFNELSRKKLLQALNEMMLEVWQKRKERDSQETFSVLASLPLSVYVTTDTSDLLYHALQAAGKEPRQELCPWNDYTEEMVSTAPTSRYEPDEDSPLIYYLFGRLSEPESLVLTEDDYFDYLIGVTRNKDLIPKVVRSRLTRSSLLLLGFRFEDWAFRAFFRSLINQEGGDLRKNYVHVSAQVTPDEQNVLDPEAAKAYLKNYFFKGAAIDVFWGTGRDFIRALQRQRGKA